MHDVGLCQGAWKISARPWLVGGASGLEGRVNGHISAAITAGRTRKRTTWWVALNDWSPLATACCKKIKMLLAYLLLPSPARISPTPTPTARRVPQIPLPVRSTNPTNPTNDRPALPPPQKLVEFQQFPAFAGGPGDDLRHWKVAFQGPAQTPFEGGTFHLAVAFPLEYPFKPPQVRFTSRVFHPNVSSAVDICLDVLKAEWSPVLSICRVLISIQSLLDDPNAMSPLNGDAARLFRENRAQYERQVRKYVRAYASE
uniref:Ubiquitin-conjugating enzyme E2 n=1 Tax=Spironucleus salmonicida TaxID=348837 RepID=V6LF99_9EUKA|eukprot:EST42968.1 Ubiquitin-conjugating enzyme E2 [Spironucleus salmonicida]